MGIGISTGTFLSLRQACHCEYNLLERKQEKIGVSSGIFMS